MTDLYRFAECSTDLHFPTRALLKSATPQKHDVWYVGPLKNLLTEQCSKRCNNLVVFVLHKSKRSKSLTKTK